LDSYKASLPSRTALFFPSLLKRERKKERKRERKRERKKERKKEREKERKKRKALFLL